MAGHPFDRNTAGQHHPRPASSIYSQPTPHLRQGAYQHPTSMQSAVTASLHGSLTNASGSGSQRSVTPTESTTEPAVRNVMGKSLPKEMIWTRPRKAPDVDHWEPPTPTSPDFPGDVLEKRHLAAPAERYREPADPSTDMLLGDVSERHNSKVASPKRKPQIARKEATRPQDPFHRTIHDAYPHVFPPDPRREAGSRTVLPPLSRPRPAQKRRLSDRAISTLGSAFDGFKRAVESFGVNRARANAKRSGLGMSIPINDSFADFSKMRSEVPSRMTKVVGDPDRGTACENFMDPDVFEPSSEENVQAPHIRISASRQGMNKGSSKLLPALPAEALAPVSCTANTQLEHTSALPDLRTKVKPKRPLRRKPAFVRDPPLDKRVDISKYDWVPDVDCQQSAIYERMRSKEGYEQVGSTADLTSSPERLPPVPSAPKPPSVAKMPRFDADYPKPDDLFSGFTDEETSAGRRDQYLQSARAAKMKQRRPRAESNAYHPAVDDLFDEIDRQTAEAAHIPDSEKPWFNSQLHRMNDQLDRERRASDGSIILDTFTHSGHTSWIATEQTDDYTIHMDHRRFPREVHDDSERGPDEAGLLMERLERQMRGL